MSASGSIGRAALVAVLLAVSTPAARAAEARSAPDFRRLYETCAPSVVTVTVVEPVGHGFLRRLGDLVNPFPLHTIPADVVDFAFYPLRVLIGGPPKATGSGVIIDAKGHVLTNHHVVEHGSIYWVTLHDRRVLRARLVGSDAAEDYALLKLDLKTAAGDGTVEIVPAKLGKSSELRPGDPVFAIGSPLGFRRTMSVGVVAAVERRLVGPFQDFIQTDLTIGSGSSGGPLFNARGEVVGLTTLMYAVLEQVGSLSLSVPIDSIREGLDRLKRTGRVVRGCIGAQVKDVTPRLVKKFQLKRRSGACVVKVKTSFWRRLPAAAAGIRPGDVIVRYGQQPVARARTLARAVLNTPPGTRVPVEFYRGDRLLKGTLWVRKR